MWIKKIAAAILSAVCLFTCVGAAASANTVETFSLVNGVSPLYEIATDAHSTLGITGSTATCSSTIAHSTAVKITAEQTLQKQGFLWIWSKYDNTTWTKTVNSSSIVMTNTKTGLASGKYRLKTVFTLTDKNGKSETITIYSDSKTV